MAITSVSTHLAIDAAVLIARRLIGRSSIK
jgi:hypothetical protein